MTPSSTAPMAMTARVMMELVPAPAMTAGMVNTPVPMMLPTTSAVDDVRPRSLGRLDPLPPEVPPPWSGGGSMDTAGGRSMVPVMAVLPDPGMSDSHPVVSVSASCQNR